MKRSRISRWISIAVVVGCLLSWKRAFELAYVNVSAVLLSRAVIPGNSNIIPVFCVRHLPELGEVSIPHLTSERASDRALILNPGSLAGLRLRGMIGLARHAFPEAANVLGLTVTQGQARRLEHFWLGCALAGGVSNHVHDVPQAALDEWRAAQAAPYFRTLGATLIRHGKSDQAEATLKLATRLDPTYGDAYFELGSIYVEQGRWQEASDTYSLAVRVGHFDEERLVPWAWYKKGKSDLFLGHWDKALDAFEEALLLHPDFVEALVGKGDAHYRGFGQINQAILAYQKALAVEPESTYAMGRLGDLFREQRDYREAQRWYEYAYLVAPDDPIVLFHLGLNAYAQQNIPQAIPWFIKSVGRDPALADAHYLLGRAYLHQGQMIEAEHELRIALDLVKGQNANYHLSLAILLETTGRLEEARSEYQAVLTISPDNEQAQLAIARILAQQTLEPSR